MRFVGVSALAITAAMMCSGAIAQEVAVEEDEVLRQQEIVVTTQFREQNLQEVPINITAYNGDFLELLGIREFDQLSLFTPGLVVQNQSPNNPGFVIRGITSDSGEATIEPRVSIYQDGVSIARSRGSFVQLFDLQRVEVAKGPQSTLFGRSALIGAINIIQNKPDASRLSGSASFGLGNFGFLEGEAFINIPVIQDELAVRVAGRYNRRDGVVENVFGTFDNANGDDLNGLRSGAIRISGRWTPNERFTGDVIFNYQQDTPPGTAFKSGTFAPPAGDTSPFTFAALNTFGGFLGGESLGLDREVWGVTALARYELSESLTFKANLGYREFDSQEVFDPDGSSLPFLVFAEQATGEQFSFDTRLEYTPNDRISGFFGLGIFQEDGAQVVPLGINEQILASFVAPGAAFPIPLSTAHFETIGNVGDTFSFDIFADVTFGVTERLDVTVGGRWTRDDKTAGAFATLDGAPSLLTTFSTIGAVSAIPGLGPLAGTLFGQPFGLLAQPTPGTVETNEQFNGFSWRVVANYEAADWLNTYLSYARGRRPEVIEVSQGATPIITPNATFTALVANPVPPSFDIVDEETVDSFEGGAKAVLLNGELTFDGSAFYYIYRDFQTTVLDPLNGTTDVVNAGRATSVGVEGQVFWRAHEFLDVFGNYGYNRSRFRGDSVFAGNQFRLSPDHKVSAGFSLRLPIDQWALVTLTPTYSWQSSVFFDDNNDIPGSVGNTADAVQDEFQDSYGLFNVRLRLSAPSGLWQLEAFADNILNREFIIDAGNTGDIFGIPTFIRGNPRLFGVRAKVTY